MYHQQWQDWYFNSQPHKEADHTFSVILVTL